MAFKADGAGPVTVSDWLRLLLAGAYTFTLAGLLMGTYAYLMAHTELPGGTSIPAAVLWILGAAGAAIVLGTLAFLSVGAIGRWLGL